MLEFSSIFVFLLIMIIAAVSDLISMTIKDWIPLFLIFIFLAMSILYGIGINTMSAHIAAAFIILLVTIPLFLSGLLGGGDAKLLTATSLWFGFNSGLIDYLITTALIGGGLGLSTLAYNYMRANTAIQTHTKPRNSKALHAGIPYGVALSIGAILTFKQTPLAKLILSNFSS